MIFHLTVLLLSTLAVSAGPTTNKPRPLVNRQVIVDPSTSRDLKVDLIEDLEPKRPTPRFAQDVVVVSDCGRAPLAPAVHGIIVGGTEAVPHSFPWQVALYIDVIHFCGGAVISDEWIMTAAHCLEGTHHVKVIAGAHNISEEEPSQVIMSSTDFFIHENWNSFKLRNDIAMIHLPQKLIFNDYIQPICLPFASESDLGVGEIVTAIGWGKTTETESISSILMEVQVPTTSNNICQNTFGDLITPNILCTDAYGDKGICHGDSGSPLNYITGEVTEARGIASFVSTSGCTSGNPDAFTRVTHYLDWIKKQTGVTRG